MTIAQVRVKTLLRILIAIGIFAFIVVTLLILFSKKSNASLAGWNAGNIMSDFTMTDKNSMNESQIQAFLKSKNNCNNRNISEANRYPNVKYRIKDGHFICMADDKFDKNGMPADSGETAAHIIWQAAQDFGINPKVLIVLLEKEQGLVSDTWPNSTQYKTATGYGCPDGAACDSQYFGLKNQIRNAARFFRAYQDNNPGWYKPYWVGTKFVQWHPNSGCGGSNVNIQNRATASLYSYTPYQPNRAALNAGYGTGDGCSSYGNRNFYNLFTDWFGDIRKQQSVDVRSNIYLPNGDYQFLSALDNNLVLDIAGAANTDGANVRLWSNNNSNAQKFRLSYNTSSSLYTITNIATGKVLDAAGGGTTNGTNVQQWSNNDTCAQKWAIRTTNNGYKILSACSGLALEVPGGVASTGRNVQIYSDNGTKAQEWVISSLISPIIKDGTYTITNASGLSLDAAGGGRTNGVNIQIWREDTSVNNQRFSLTRMKDGFYKITSLNSGKSLDLLSSQTANGTNIQLWDYNQSVCASRWIIYYGNGAYAIESACAKSKVLDIAGGATTTNGANVRLWDANNSKAQQWYFRSSAPIVNNGTYRIAPSINNNKNWSINEDSKNAGAALHLWSRTEVSKTAQSFEIRLENDGYYSIKNVNSRLYIDLVGANIANGAKIHQWSKNDTCAQKWDLQKLQSGAVIFKSACLGSRAIDLDSNNINNGTKIQLWSSDNNNKAQQWVLNNVF